MEPPSRTYNVNVGVLGHVDSGKTSLGERAARWRPWPPSARQAHRCALRAACPAVAALSTQLSTAALDKNPQSMERGITLDLGFSSFSVRTAGGAAAWRRACAARGRARAARGRAPAHPTTGTRATGVPGGRVWHRAVHARRLPRPRLADPHHHRGCTDHRSHDPGGRRHQR